jgi:putative membrane protein
MVTSRFFARLLINAAALWVATRIVPGVTYAGGWLPFFAVAFIFGIVNASIGRATKILTIPLIVVTLGLFILVVNGLMLWLTSAVAQAFDIGFHVAGFWAALFGAFVVSIVSMFLNIVLAEKPVVRTTGRSQSYGD